MGGGEGNTVHHNSRIPRIFLYTCGCLCVVPSVTRKLEGWEEGEDDTVYHNSRFPRIFLYTCGCPCGSLSYKEVGRVGGGKGDTVHHNSCIPKMLLYTCGCLCMVPSVTREGWEEGNATLCITTPLFLGYFYCGCPCVVPSVTRKLEGKVTLGITTPAFLGYFYIPVGVRLWFPSVTGKLEGWEEGEGDTVHHNSRIPRICLYTCGCPCVVPSVTRKLEGWEEGMMTLCITTTTFLGHFYIPVGVHA